METTTLLTGGGYLLLIIGLAGAVIPIIPGPLCIWLGALLWAWGDGFQAVGWPTLLVLGMLAVLAWGVDLMLTTVVSRRAGASWRSIGGAVAGGFLGAIFASGVIPIFGTLVGAALGAFMGMWSVEYYTKRDRQAATRAVRAYIGSMALAAIIEISLSLTMIALFAWQALG